MPLGPSSSPAFRASQRRAEQVTDIALRHGSRTPPCAEGGQYAAERYRHEYERPYEPVLPPSFQSQASEQRASGTQQRGYANPPRYQQLLSEAQTHPSDRSHAPPMCQGIRLVPVTTLPDRLRTVFPYPTFNAVQSKCFDTVFRTDDNFVLASPTGSGKTVILELAVCRAIATNATGQYKVVYQAPTKALCSERQRDWEAKFHKMGLKCAELTGDSDVGDLRNVQSANIIITTPEKWDSMTRKWKDHEKLMRLIRVFLIDEVHILKDDRGATLETVVSRMKSIGTDVRFVALSATVPNFHDIAAWLGKNSSEPSVPAANEKFGEEFRPVKLRKHVKGYPCNTSNEFGFEKLLDAKIPEIIATYSQRKPMMVFCATRNSTVNTAKLIANWWISSSSRDRMWGPPTKPPHLLNKELRDTAASGVAFHHAGLDLDDRTQIEKGFIAGEINVICCTSTLAVGVNLPCHLVIIKNTMAWGAEGLQEYSDLEMMQMLGRAGRPQYDDSAVAVIMTRQAKVRRYEMLVTGQDLIESKLHLNLIDHMNAEIGLGTINDLASARKWLRGTFLYVRLQQNPGYYKLDGARSGQSIEEQVDDICFRDITLLRGTNLVSGEEHFRCTEFGLAMARYYVHFETMRVFMELGPKSTPSEIVSNLELMLLGCCADTHAQLSAIAQAVEYSTIRFRQGEKSFYKLLNKSASIRWSIPVNLDLPAQKVSLIIQSVLGSADISWDGEAGRHRSQYLTETQIIFKNIGSLIRCIIDCQIVLGDSVSIHSALMLERSLGARVWDDSPLQMKQIGSIGVVAVRKLVNAGVKTMEDLEGCESYRIEALVGRNPPFGLEVLEKVRSFPKLRVSLHARPSTVSPHSPCGVRNLMSV
jgi:ATP-dependent DNA helicase HFM1/MER3